MQLAMMKKGLILTPATAMDAAVLNDYTEQYCTVTIKPPKRSVDQNAISHAWYAEISAIRGDMEPEDVKCEAKAWCGVPIMREDDDFRERYDRLIRDRYSLEEKQELMRWLPVTSLMGKKQMSRYLEAMQVFYRKAGIELQFPDDNSWMMGG